MELYQALITLDGWTFLAQSRSIMKHMKSVERTNRGILLWK